MRHIRKALAVIAAAAAVTFTQTAVFAANDYPFATDRAGYVETTNLAGSGTLADPYIAYNAGQLKWVFKNGGYARLGKDITLTGDDAATLYVYSDEVHLDLAGFTYTVNFSNGGCVIDTGQSNTLYITDSKSGGAIRTNGTAIRAGISAKVHINGGTLAADGRAVRERQLELALEDALVGVGEDDARRDLPQKAVVLDDLARALDLDRLLSRALQRRAEHRRRQRRLRPRRPGQRHRVGGAGNDCRCGECNGENRPHLQSPSAT